MTQALDQVLQFQRALHEQCSHETKPTGWARRLHVALAYLHRDEDESLETQILQATRAAADAFEFVDWLSAQMSQTDSTTALVLCERERQNNMWGVQDYYLGAWCLILGEEVGEVDRALFHRYQKGWAPVREEAVHVAAVALQIIECLLRRQVKGGVA